MAAKQAAAERGATLRGARAGVVLERANARVERAEKCGCCCPPVRHRGAVPVAVGQYQRS